MRSNSQNNQFIFNLPQSFITKETEDKFQILLDKNFIPYNDVMDYISSTILNIVFPSVSYGKVEQKLWHGKNYAYREAGNIADKFQGEIDITFRSVDSHLNYFILLEIATKFYLNDDPNHLDPLSISILDKDGDLIYTIVLRDVLISSLSDLRLSYSATDFTDKEFSLQISYNFIDIEWSIGRDELVNENIFDTVQIHDPLYIDDLVLEKEKRDQESFQRIGK